MADLLQEMSQRLHAGGNVFSGDLVAGDRFSANQQTVERARDPKIIRRELLAGFLGAIFVGVGGDHVPFPRSELYSFALTFVSYPARWPARVTSSPFS